MIESDPNEIVASREAKSSFQTHVLTRHAGATRTGLIATDQIKLRDHETAMQVYIQLAMISDQKRQHQVRDRFLLLAGVEACRAGYLDVAECCHQKLIASNPAHLAHQHLTMADALRDEDFQQVVAHWERYCPFEKAEAMLRQLNLPPQSSDGLTISEQMLQLLKSERH